MNILVVGGTGLTGATTAAYLKAQGHKVTIMARSRPSSPELSDYPYIVANYIEDELTEEQ